MSNPILKAIERLEKSVLAIVKRRMVQEAPKLLIAAYNEFLQPGTTPDRTAKKSKRLYYSRPNTTNKLRRLYGNITRAIAPGEEGNITEVTVNNGMVQLVSGIDENARVNAGPDTVTLEYARFHEEGTKNFKARPFLNPGFEFFIKEYLPVIVEQVEEDLVEEFNGG